VTPSFFNYIERIYLKASYHLIFFVLHVLFRLSCRTGGVFLSLEMKNLNRNVSLNFL
jgi:hypothetical protein